MLSTVRPSNRAGRGRSGVANLCLVILGCVIGAYFLSSFLGRRLSDRTAQDQDEEESNPILKASFRFSKVRVLECLCSFTETRALLITSMYCPNCTVSLAFTRLSKHRLNVHWGRTSYRTMAVSLAHRCTLTVLTASCRREIEYSKWRPQMWIQW